MYHLRAVSLNILTISLHFSESSTLNIAIWALMAIIFSWGSPLPLNDTKDGGLKFMRTRAYQISVVSGWRSIGSSSSTMFDFMCCCRKSWALFCYTLLTKFYETLVPRLDYANHVQLEHIVRELLNHIFFENKSMEGKTTILVFFKRCC